MNELRLHVSVAISVAILLGMILVQVQSANAALPLFGGVKKLQVYVKLYSADSKTKNVLVSVQYQGVLKTQEVTMTGVGYKTVSIVFPPLKYGLADVYTACAKNKNTYELNCGSMIWWDHNQPSYITLTVYNTH